MCSKPHKKNINMYGLYDYIILHLLSAAYVYDFKITSSITLSWW